MAAAGGPGKGTDLVRQRLTTGWRSAAGPLANERDLVKTGSLQGRATRHTPVGDGEETILAWLTGTTQGIARPKRQEQE